MPSDNDRDPASTLLQRENTYSQIKLSTAVELEKCMKMMVK